MAFEYVFKVYGMVCHYQLLNDFLNRKVKFAKAIAKINKRSFFYCEKKNDAVLEGD